MIKEKNYVLVVDGAIVKKYKTKQGAINRYNKILDSQQMAHINSMKIIKKYYYV